MNIFKLILSFAIMLFCQNDLIAQKFRTVEQFQAYFLDNYQYLDNIEGIWSVFGTIYAAPMDYDISQTNNIKSYSVAIIKENGQYSEYVIENGFYKPQNWSNIFKRNGNFIKCTHSTMNDINWICSDFSISQNKFSFTCHSYSYYENEKYFTKYSYNYVRLFPLESDITQNSEIQKEQHATGTGFAISSNGYIATCNHVVDGASTVKVRGVGGDFSKYYSAKVVCKDANNDLAIVKIDDPSFSTLGIIPFFIKSSTAEVGTDIFVLGYPLTATMGDEIKLTNGIISAKSGFQGDITSYQMSAPIQPGNSGAPLFDKNGNLIGIVNSKHTGAENAGYAIKTSYLINLIESLTPMPKLTTQNSLYGKPLTEQVKLINKFVYIIEVE